MNLNNEKFFIPSSGTFDLSQFTTYEHKKLYNTCGYCNSQLLNQENRCTQCGAPKNSYKIKERNYNE